MVYVGDIGVEIVYDCLEDISAATVLRLNYRKPGGGTGFWAGVADGTQALKFTTAAVTDLDRAGLWRIQPYIEIPGFAGFADAKMFRVAQRV